MGLARKGWLLAALAALVIGCGADSPTVAARDRSADAQEVPAELANGLTPVAKRVAEQWRSSFVEAGRGDHADFIGDGTDWWIIIAVDVPLDDAAIGDPLAALPAPFDGVAPVVGRFNVDAESPLGPLGLGVDPSEDLRSRLASTSFPVTTIPDEEPEPTTAWSASEVRISSIAVPVAAFDAAPSADEILAGHDLETIRLGVSENLSVVSLADVVRGVSVTPPPLTGTTFRAPSTGSPTTGIPPSGSPSTTGPADY